MPDPRHPYNLTMLGAPPEVWFDDARSIQARLRLVDIYGLGGVSYWTINSFTPKTGSA